MAGKIQRNRDLEAVADSVTQKGVEAIDVERKRSVCGIFLKEKYQ